ncbi:MAG: transposase, partial [Chloroflexi bacterium]|nr:transposase [Chloroflexota bacterium]
APLDHSSEPERKLPTEHHKRAKLTTLTIDREQILTIDPATLPPDARFTGYKEVTVQDLRLQTDNVRFLKEEYYAASTKETYLAPLPAGYAGAFGPGVKALTLVFYYASQMSEPKILEFFQHVGVQISAGTVSNLLIKGHEAFHAEQDAAYLAGLRSTPWQHLDDTLTRVNGRNEHCQVICNPLHTTYRTTPKKDRLTIIDVLNNGQARRFLLNDDALAYLDALGIAQVRRRQLLHLPRDQMLSEETLLGLLAVHLPGVGAQTQKWILEALAVSAYHVQREVPIVRLLMCDDAPQFQWVTDELALCWVHAGRHFKKLEPCVALHRAQVETFLKEFWSYYHALRCYAEAPTAAERARLEQEFERLFSRQTGYWALDERIRVTRAKKEALLVVLAHPEVPLHNNAAELGARQRVRKRDVSFGPRTAEGRKAWDTFMSLAATTKKLGVSFYAYIHDRVSETNLIPALAEIIDARAADLNLGASWEPAQTCPGSF